MNTGSNVVPSKSVAIALMLICHDVQFHEYENDNHKKFRNGKIIPMWNGQWTFSYHRPNGGEVIDYHETLALHPSKEIAEQMMYDVVHSLNLKYFPFSE